MPRVPRVTDDDIKKLCSKYKSNLAQNENGKEDFRDCAGMINLRNEIRLQAKTMVKDINRSMNRTARDIRNLQSEQLNSYY